MEVIDDHARGLFLGLLLGDALGTSVEPDRALTGTCLSQLACFTLEGLVRASVRYTEKGVCHPPSVVWHGWRRWAHLQGIHAPEADPWPAPGAPWPDGWLHEVGSLSVRRGSAPATVKTLRSSNAPPDDTAKHGQSAGHHAMTRGLAVALYSSGDDADSLARQLAALTHGHPEAIAAAGLATATAANLVRGGDGSVTVLEAAAEKAARMTVSTSPGTAPHALVHGARAAAIGEGFEEVVQLSRLHGPGAVTTATALFGALRGVFELPQGDLARLDLAWVGDVLVRDALAQLHKSARDAHQTSAITWARYPGW